MQIALSLSGAGAIASALVCNLLVVTPAEEHCVQRSTDTAARELQFFAL